MLKQLHASKVLPSAAVRGHAGGSLTQHFGEGPVPLSCSVTSSQLGQQITWSGCSGRAPPGASRRLLSRQWATWLRTTLASRECCAKQVLTAWPVVLPGC